MPRFPHKQRVFSPSPVLSRLIPSFSNTLSPYTSFLKANRGIIIVGIFVFAAVITPPDVVSQLMLGLPMVALFQLSLGICTLVDRSNSRKKAAQADAIS